MLILEEPNVVNTVFTYFRSYTDGFLPFAGALTDQPNNLVEALMEISIVKDILDAEDADTDNDNNEEGDFKSIIKGKS